MPVAGPYFLAYVEPGTEFDPDVHNVMDEYVFSYRRILSEGDKPKLQLRIRNPHIGLLNVDRKQWVWFSRDSGTSAGIIPLFYGRLKAAPKDIYKEMMTVDLIAWPLDYNRQRQKLAAEIRANGPYDEIFISVEKRDDPDVLLEAVSGLYHVDPVTHEVTISDILNGEDGNVDITADEHLYDEMVTDVEQATSITSILIDATVSWNQTAQGFVDMGAQVIETFAGDAVIADWPQPLSSLGGGWSVAIANAVDRNAVNAIVTGSFQYSWTNKEKEHSDGDQLSLSQSANVPVGLAGGSQNVVLTFADQPGVLDPFATDGNGDPSPTNIPPHQEVTFGYVPKWKISTSLMLSYRDLERMRTERVQMLLESDLQPVLVRPEIEQSSEVIVKNGADIGIPVIRLLNRTTLDGEAVSLGVIVFPDNPSVPGRRSAQIVTTAGTLAETQPNYSDIPGDTTVDGTAVLTSLGTPAPSETAFDWPANTNIGLGTIILPRKPLFLTWRQLTEGGRQQFPQVGTQLSRGTLIKDSNGFYHFVSLPGLSGLTEPSFTTTRGVVTTDGSAEWKCIGNLLPDGKTHFLCVQAGLTSEQFLIPQFDSMLHAQTADNGVMWASIGQGEIPAGGSPGDVWAASYFDTDRAKTKTIPYLISVGRARARLKARAVGVEFVPVDPFGKGLALTLRKTATVHDSRLGGGIAEGKLTYVEHACDGHSGREICRARIGCAIGKDNAIEAADGEESYFEDGDYYEDCFTRDGEVRVISDDSDVGFSPPVIAPNDDGLRFPLTKDQVVISEGVRGSMAEQTAAVQKVLANMAEAAKLAAIPAGGIDGSAEVQRKIAKLSAFSITTATSLHPIWYDCVLKPPSGWQFNNFVRVNLTKFTCQKGIDLGAASTP